MIYLHSAPYGDNIIRHWANNIEIDDGTKLYLKGTHKIKQIETGTIYDDAVDVLPCQYTYEATDIVIAIDEEAEAEDYENALGRFGV